MEETPQTPPRQTGSKKIAAIVIAAVLVVGVAVAAFMMINKSPKEKYFTAEKNSLDFIQEQFNKRYAPETKWAEETQEKPTKASYDVSAQFNDPNNNFGVADEAEILNNSSLKINTETDYKKKIAKSDIAVNVNGLEIGGLKFGLTKDELTVNLPFVNDTLLIKDKDLPNLMEQLTGEPKQDDIEFDFSQFFDGGLPEKDQEYLQKEYLGMIYKELPEDAFEAAKETVKVDNKSVDTEKIQMHLTEKQTKDILVKVLDKAKDDKRLQKILQTQWSMQNLGMQIDPANSIQFNKEFKEGMEEAKKEIKDVQIPNGISSTIWVEDDLIVKRDFSIKAGSNKDNLEKVTIKGTQQLGEDKQTFDYDLKSKSDFNETGGITIKGSFSFKDDKIKDNAEISGQGIKLNYEGKESLKNDKRTFDRVFSFKEASNKPYNLAWSGTANYKKATMDSDHTIKFNAPDMGGDILAIFIKKDAEHVKQVKAPAKDNVKDIGSMTLEEIEDYFGNDVLPKIQSQFGF